MNRGKVVTELFAMTDALDMATSRMHYMNIHTDLSGSIFSFHGEESLFSFFIEDERDLDCLREEVCAWFFEGQPTLDESPYDVDDLISILKYLRYMTMDYAVRMVLYADMSGHFELNKRLLLSFIGNESVGELWSEAKESALRVIGRVLDDDEDDDE